MPDLTPATLASANSAFANGGATGSLPLVIAKSAIPFISVSSGTMGNNGALSAITALPRTFSNGAYILLPAGAIAAGVPAASTWYWAVFSSTTAATVYNSTYTSGVPAAGVTTAFSTTGPGAFTGSTAEDAGPITNLGAGVIKVNSQLRHSASLSLNSTVNSKAYRLRWSGIGGTSIFSTGTNASVTGVQIENVTAASVLTNAQVSRGKYSNSAAAFGLSGPTTSAIDTTAATTMVISLQKATATDNMILEDYSFDLVP